MLKDLEKMLKSLTKNKTLMLLGGVLLAYALFNYSQGKGMTLSGMDNQASHHQQQAGSATDGGWITTKLCQTRSS